MNKEYILEASNLTCDYAEGEAKIRGVMVDSVAIPRVGITVIVGPSGCGKSTLLSLLSGIRRPTSFDENAQLIFNDCEFGKRLDLLSNNRAAVGRVGYVFQEPHLIKDISAKSNAEIAQKLLNIKSSPFDVAELANEFELSEVIDQRADTLSGGQAQRVAIVRALSINPDLLICDEPTSSLDEETGKVLLKIVKAWAEENQKAVLWVTHNLEQAAEFSDHVITVEEGRLCVNDDGSPFDITNLTYEQKLLKLRGGEVENTVSQSINPSDEAPTGGEHTSRGWLAYIFKIVFEYFYMSNGRVKGTSVLSGFIKALWQPLRKSNFTFLIALSILVFTMLFKVEAVGSKFFDDQLSKPEVSHFVFSSGDTGKFPLDMQNISGLKNSIARRIESTNVGVIFPRREDFLKLIIPSEKKSCDRFGFGEEQNLNQAKPARLMVFDAMEPLYSGLVKAPGDGVDLKSIVFGTPDLLASFGGRNFKYACLDIDGTFVPFQIHWGEQKIPGGTDRTFFTGMTEKAFEYWHDETKSRNFSDLNYSYAAVYFQKNNVGEVLCAFEKTEKCIGDPIRPNESDILLNKDVFKQISQFSLQARLAQAAIIILVICFSLVMIASLMFATSSDVKTQERSLAILRAFGVTGLKITLIFQMRSVVQLFYSLFFASLVFAFFAILIDDAIEPQKVVEGLNVSLFAVDLIIPVLLTFIITQIVTFLVVLSWSYRNKYVAEKLQGL